MKTLAILREAETRTGKTRLFSALCLAWMTADPLWDGGRADTKNVIRPVYLALAGSEAALRPFLANLRLGRKAALHGASAGYSQIDPNEIALLRSTTYATTFQRHDAGTIAQVYLPEVFTADPGMIDPAFVSFLVTTPLWWHVREMERLTADREMAGRILAHAHRAGLHNIPARARHGVGNPGPAWSDDDLLALVPEAARFAQFLDRRTRRPIPNDPAFYLQAYTRAFDTGLASRALEGQFDREWDRRDWARGLRESDMNRMGFRPSAAFHGTTARVDAFLAGEVRLYHESLEADHG